MITKFYLNRFQNLINNLFNINKPCNEVLTACYHKLPKEIQIEWFRDGKYIIGAIEVDGSKYKTQALSADEFVEMVNDTLYTVYDIPNNCLKELSKAKRFAPTAEEFRRLNDVAIKHSNMSLAREKELVIA